MPDLLVVVDDVAQVVSAAVVSLAHAHRVVREVHVAVVAEDWRCHVSYFLDGWREGWREGEVGGIRVGMGIGIKGKEKDDSL